MKKLVLMLMLCAPMTVFAQKFGHVDAQQVMQSLPEFIKARGDFEAQSKQFENDLKAMDDEIQRQSDEYARTTQQSHCGKKCLCPFEWHPSGRSIEERGNL